MSAVMDDSQTTAKPKKAAPEVETVEMTDGRKVDFVGVKRKMLKEVVLEGDNVSVRFDFRNGETRLFLVPQALLLPAAGHGVSQKLGDMTAGEEDVDDMVVAVDTGIERLNAGDWNVRREGNGFAGASILLRALVEKSGKTLEAIKAFLSTKTQEDKIALRRSPAIKPIVERLEAEKASKGSKVNVAELEAELDAL